MTKSDFTRRGFLLGSAAAGVPALLSACSSTSSSNDLVSQAKQKGYVKIGIAGEIPYGYTSKSGAVTGEAPAVARAIFKNLGVPSVKAQQVDFDSLIPGLNARQFDMVCAGMDILPARCQQAQFSDPDYQALVSFLVPKGNPKNVKNFDDVKAKGVKLATEVGAVEATYATGSGVPSGDIMSFASPDEMLSAVTTGRVYAAVLTDISLKSLASQNPNAAVEVTTGFEPVINGKKTTEVGGFVFRKGDASTLKQFNAQLKKLHGNGEWLKIAAPFGFTKGNIPPANVTTQELCATS
jgi:polar amino acid transport system substrate-binding protein